MKWKEERRRKNPEIHVDDLLSVMREIWKYEKCRKNGILTFDHYKGFCSFALFLSTFTLPYIEYVINRLLCTNPCQIQRILALICESLRVTKMHLYQTSFQYLRIFFLAQNRIKRKPMVSYWMCIDY